MNQPQPHTQWVFLGIGGMGMSAIARYYHAQGFEVLGYDRSLGPVASELQREGIWVTTDPAGLWDSGRLKPPTETRVVYTAAIPETSTLLGRLREEGYILRKRAIELAELVNEKDCIAIAGTHGKTTTASILTHLLVSAGYPVTSFLGGISEDYGTNFIHSGEGQNRVFVVEADEFDRSFLHLFPRWACVTSLDADHLDIYGTPEQLEAAYRQFIGQISNSDGMFAPKRLGLPGFRLALEEEADFSFRNIRVRDGGYDFDFLYPGGTLRGLRTQLPGRHNLYNALCALSLATRVTNPAMVAAGLGSCKGVWRRFNWLEKGPNRVVVDDYAHHPSEIDAVCDALRELYPGRKVFALFQPHLFSRTRDFGAEFARSLSRFDSVRLMEIYPAREEPLPGIDSSWLLRQMEHADKDLLERDSVGPWLQGITDGVVAVMGAGDIGEEVRKWINLTIS